PYGLPQGEWDELGKKAGPLRNQRMLDEGKPDLVVAFPGGGGTKDMVRRAVQAGGIIHEGNRADDWEVPSPLMYADIWRSPRPCPLYPNSGHSQNASATEKTRLILGAAGQET